MGVFEGQAYQYSGFGATSSRYLSPNPAANPIQDLALPPSNPGVVVQQYYISPTRVLMGTVAPQEYVGFPRLPGGAQQMFVPSRSVLTPTLLLPGN